MKFPKLRYAYSVEQAAEWAEEWCEDTRKWLEALIEDREPDIVDNFGEICLAEKVLERLKE